MHATFSGFSQWLQHTATQADLGRTSLPLAQAALQLLGVKASALFREVAASTGDDYAMPRLSPKDPAELRAGEINKELDRIDALDRAAGQEMIRRGRGHERYTDWWDKPDPLSRAQRAISERRSALQREIDARYGPGAPSRLPRGLGPIRRG